MRVSKNIAVTALLASLTNAISLDLNDKDSIKSAAKTIAGDLVQNYYTGKSEIPGLLPEPWYFWSAGATWDSLINYWYLTGDTQFNDIVSQALLFQTGPNRNYMPLNQSTAIGNDDQATWGLAALSAAEREFPDKEGSPRWIDLATAVFSDQSLRWTKEQENGTCGGGLRWQIFTFNNGYNYKQSGSWFFLLASRLGAFTKNETYTQWAEKTYDWASKTGLISEDFAVYDGASVEGNCSKPNRLEWSYNQAAYLYGSAILYNLTSSDTWRARVEGHLSRFTSVYFHNGGDNSSSTGNGTILYEVACESEDHCDVDQKFYKGIAARWAAQAALAAPFITDKISPLIKSSASAAAAACDEGSDKSACKFSWYEGDSSDTKGGVPEQLSALEVIQQNLARVTTGSGNSTTTTPSGTAAGSSTASATGSASSSTGTSVPGAGAVVKVSWAGIATAAFVALIL